MGNRALDAKDASQSMAAPIVIPTATMIATWTSSARTSAPSDAPMARRSVRLGVFCTVRITKKIPTTSVITTSASVKMIVNDVVTLATPGSESTAVCRSSASTPATSR